MKIPYTFEGGPLNESQIELCRCIVIDGDPGAGKTYLAKLIAEQFKAAIISLDDYILGDGRPYVEQINCAKVKASITAAREKMTIIEGVCLLQILPMIEVKHDYHIFLKSIASFLGWDLGEWLKPRAVLPKSRLKREVVQYYKTFKPYEICDTIGWRDSHPSPDR